MVIIIYFLTFILSAFMLISFLIRNKKADTMIVLFSLVITMNCLGRLMLGFSTNLDMALWANKFLYIGAIYSPFLANMILMRITEIPYSKYLASVMIWISTFVLVVSFTVGHSPIYYKQVSLGHTETYSYLIKSYGPLHILFPLLMFINLGIMIFCIMYALKNRQRIPTKTVVMIALVGISIIFIYVLERLLHAKISYLSVGYLLGCIILAKYFERIHTFDFSLIIAHSIERMKEHGFIIFDQSQKFIFANDFTKGLFPEIQDAWRRDFVVSKTDSFLYETIIDWALHAEHDQSKNIYFEDEYYKITSRDLFKNKKNIGKLIEIVNRTDEHRYIETVERYNENLRKDVAKKTVHISKIKDKILFGMAMMIESRDDSTGGHIKRTSDVVNVFAKHLLEIDHNYDKEFLDMVSRAAPMHDLGKIAIHDEILRKPGRFTEEEYEEMKRHAEEGAVIVHSILKDAESEDFVKIAVNIAHFHHEKWNGEGYPTGISGEQIPVEARIMALADVFDALVSKRCYKEKYSYENAFRIIEESIGTHFDPNLGKEFIACRKQLEQLYDEYPESC